MSHPAAPGSCRAASSALACRLVTPARMAAALALVALALPAAGQSPAPGRQGPSAFADLGGGGAVSGSRGDATSGGVFEAEVGAGYDLGQGLRPELGLLVGLAPTGYLGLRPGLRYTLDQLPFSFRGALDFAAPHGSWRMRFLLAGAATEVRFTDLLGVFAQADLGIPVASKAGLAFLVRAGVSVRL